MNLFQLTHQQTFLFTLVFFRVGAFFTTAPVFGGGTVPIKVRVLASLVLSFVLFPTLPVDQIPYPPPNLGVYLVGIAEEIAIGLLIGFTAATLFAAFQVAGSFIDREMGMAMANVLDPVSNQQVSILGQLHFLFALVVWVAMEGHLAFIKVFAESFHRVHPMSFVYDPAFFEKLPKDVGAYVFSFSVKVGAPAMVAIFLTTVGLGFLAKTVPEMNIFILGFAFRIGVGFIVVFFSIPMVAYLVRVHQENMMEIVENTIRVIGGG